MPDERSTDCGSPRAEHGVLAAQAAAQSPPATDATEGARASPCTAVGAGAAAVVGGAAVTAPVR